MQQYPLRTQLVLQRGNRGYEKDDDEMQEMRTGHGSLARLQRELTPDA